MRHEPKDDERLQEAGTVLHLARSGRLIVKAVSQVRDGTTLVDEKGRKTGRVIETIGPVVSPYFSVQPFTDRIERIVGTRLFVSEIIEPESRRIPSRFNRRVETRGYKGFLTENRREKKSK